jgi:hypothetical protein
LDVRLDLLSPSSLGLRILPLLLVPLGTLPIYHYSHRHRQLAERYIDLVITSKSALTRLVHQLTQHSLDLRAQYLQVHR